MYTIQLKISNGSPFLLCSDWFTGNIAAVWLASRNEIEFCLTAWSAGFLYAAGFMVKCSNFILLPVSTLTLHICFVFALNLKSQKLNMGAECGFQTKQQLNECILRCPWSEYPLPPVHRACRDGDILSLTYLTIQGDRLAVFHSINAQDQFLMWTPIHWAAYFGKVSFKIKDSLPWIFQTPLRHIFRNLFQIEKSVRFTF